MLFKNVASQKIHIYAYDSTTGAAKTGDAANITGYVSLDGTANAIDDTNPAEVDSTDMPGLYVFDLTQAETNCNAFALVSKSSTANIRIEPIIGFTTGAAITQTGDAFARLGAPAGASVSADVAAVKADSAAILTDTGTTLDTLIKDIPTNAEFEARTLVAAGYGTAANQSTIIGYIDTEVAAILAAVDTEVAAIKAKTDNLPASPAATGAAMTLTAAYDAAKTAATQASVNTIDDFLDTEIAAILADTNELQTDLVNGGRLDLLIDAIKAKTDNLPTDPADQSAVEAAITAATSGLATAAALDAVDNYIDTEVAAIKAVTDKLDTAVELDGAVYRLTENALEQAPTGGTAPTVEQIRAEIDANSTQLAAIVADTNELQTDLTNGGRVDLLIDGIKAKTDKMTYTSGNDLDVNVQKINDVTLTGNGSTTPIGAA